MSEADRAQILSKATEIVGRDIYPAWRESIACLKGQLLQATDDAGLWRLRNGDASYANLLRRYRTTNLTAEEIHQAGLEQVHRIEAEMDRLFRTLGRTRGSVADRTARLALDLQYKNPTWDESRALIMRDMDGIIRDALLRSESLFDIRPVSPVIAKPYPKITEANTAASYFPPAADGSRPGTFQFPRRLDRMTRFTLRTTVYHETVPGHHFQLALQAENKTLPRFRQMAFFDSTSAFDEGWGLYAERLVAESGWYEKDVEGLLGQLNQELFRPRRVVADTGLPTKRWTRQQAINYGISASEVERYVVMPGQACSYMTGQMRILAVRDKAKRALGQTFSLKQFHNVLLTTGSVPLDTLERRADSFIASQKKA